jgi:hypothetical protein
MSRTPSSVNERPGGVCWTAVHSLHLCTIANDLTVDLCKFSLALPSCSCISSICLMLPTCGAWKRHCCLFTSGYWQHSTHAFSYLYILLVASSCPTRGQSPQDIRFRPTDSSPHARVSLLQHRNLIGFVLLRENSSRRGTRCPRHIPCRFSLTQWRHSSARR